MPLSGSHNAGDSGHLGDHNLIDTTLGQKLDGSVAASTYLSQTAASAAYVTKSVGLPSAVYEGLPVSAYGNSYLAEEHNNTAASTRYINRLVSRMRLTPLTNNSVGGTWMQEAAAKAVGSAPYAAGQPGLVIIDAVLNDILNSGTSAKSQSGFQQGLAAMLWTIMAANRIEDSTFTKVGTWGTNSLTTASASSLSQPSTDGATATVAATGTDFVLLGHSYDPGVGTLGTYNLTVDGAAVITGGTNASCSTHGVSYAPSVLGVMTSLTNASHSFVLTGVSVAGKNLFVDCLLRLNYYTPTILLFKSGYLPNYTGGTAGATDATVDLYNGLLDTVVSQVRAAYSRTNIVVVDPNAKGWNKATMIGTDGIHPNDRGEAFLAALAQAALVAYDTDFRQGLNAQ